MPHPCGSIWQKIRIKINTMRNMKINPVICILSIVGLAACAPKADRVITPCQGRVECHSIYSPELGKTMYYDVFLPEQYGEQAMPVLYMHDGQNIFDSTHTWMHQEWQVDEAIARLSEHGEIRTPIVVGIYNDRDRGVDYMPANYYDQLTEEERKKGLNLEGFDVPEPHSQAYLDFICHTLKPHIDSVYNTLPDRKNTAMMGSSMGALVSVYAAAYCPEYFGCCMGLSFPALESIWPLQQVALRANTDTLTRLYIDTGDAGLDAKFFPAFNEVEPILQENGYSEQNLMVRIFPGEDHNETCWAKRVEIPIRWAFE